MTTTIELVINNKRKFLSDVEVYSPSARLLSTADQVESNLQPKKVKLLDTDRSSAPTITAEETDNMMICENSNPTETKKSPAMIIPKHCNGICDADASPTTFIMRCYCDPYRLNGLVPYHSDIY